MSNHVHLMLIPKIQTSNTGDNSRVPAFADISNISLKITHLENPPAYYLEPLNCKDEGYALTVGLDIVDYKRLRISPVLLGPIDEGEWRLLIRQGIIYNDLIVTPSETIYFLTSRNFNILRPIRSNLIIDYFSKLVNKIISGCTDYLEIPDSWFYRRIEFKKCFNSGIDLKYKITTSNMPDLVRLKLKFKLGRVKQDRVVYITTREKLAGRECLNSISELVILSLTLFNSKLPLSENVEYYISQLLTNGQYLELVRNCVRGRCIIHRLDQRLELHYDDILRFHGYLMDVISKYKLDRLFMRTTV